LIYIRPGQGSNPQKADRFIVFKRVKKVKHPKTRAKLGELIRIQGVLEVTSVQSETASARIITSFDAIFRGNEVAAFDGPSLQSSFSSTVSSTPLSGYIVEMKEQKTLNGQHDVVYLDMGRQQGVSPGDRFNVTRSGKKTSRFSPGKGVQLPGYVIGQLEVIGTQESTATARILQANEAVIKGDRVQTP
jgi:chemotaxis protein MotB